jgi:hypothetical protein
MADTKSLTSRTFARHVAPFAPLALALAMNAVPPHAAKPAKEAPVSDGAIAAERCDEIVDFQDCHSRFPTGCSPAAGYDAYLNSLKNEIDPPPPLSTPVKFLAQQDYAGLDANIPSGLTRSNHSDFQDQLKGMGEGQPFGVIGFLYYFQPTGAESSNCELTGPSDDPEKSNVDYHIGIGFDSSVAQGLRADENPTSTTASPKRPPGKSTRGSGASALQQTSVIVEMTPHYRFQFEHNIWTVENLQKALGHQVRVIGQLLIDNDHNVPSQNCAAARTPAQKRSCWRASVWELHPVEHFQVCTKGTNDCAPDDDANWAELDQI